MKKRWKVVCSASILAASLLLTSPVKRHNTNNNNKEDLDVDNDHYTYEEAFVYPEETVFLEDVEETLGNEEEVNNEEVFEEEETAIIEEEQYQFGYVTENVVVYDSYCNEIDNIEQYQKVLVVTESQVYKLVEYVDSNNITRTGYVYSSYIKELPGTFIEVDLSDQSVDMFIDGERVISDLVVTGNPSTPTTMGCYSIYAMERNVDLKAYYPDGSLKYSSFVNYWMPFNGGIGLHDAEYHTDDNGKFHGWRGEGEFGGNTYSYNGSHGCVNLRNSIAKEIYENSTIGTTVLVHK